MRKPLLVFDGECGFCRTWVRRWAKATGDEVDYAPYQAVEDRFPQIERARFAAAVHFFEPDGRISTGAEATFRALSYARGGGAGLWLYEHLPGFSELTELLYRLVAANRKPLSTLTRWMWGAHVVPPGEHVTVEIFLRALGVVYVAAFLSLWVQVGGLIGREGIYPVEGFLNLVRDRYGLAGAWWYPTLCWLAPGETSLHVLCALGVAAGLTLLAGAATMPALILAWASYLSLATVSQDFLWFQWDSLLLETGLLAMFLHPGRWRWRRADDDSPSRAGIFLLRWLVFRLMFSSAVVKITSGDPAWRSLTALEFHYETQPLPPWTAWFAHQLPDGFQRASAAGMFVVEGALPFLIFAPRRLRIFACMAMIALQVGIALTGNYGVFNLLTIALCLLLLDDAAWPGRRTVVALDETVVADSPVVRQRTGVLKAGLVVALFLLSLVPLVGAFRRGVDRLGPLVSVYRSVVPLRAVNSYGLFSVMTTRRPEILVEGSHDGVTWLGYEFHWKPGDPARRPDFVAPHMPRLDWQMWFAALGEPRRELWFLRFSQRLLSGSKPVTRLLAKNPFADRPPRYLRATLWDYRFTDAETKRRTGEWWTRSAIGPYVPVLTLVDGGLTGVPPDSLGR